MNKHLKTKLLAKHIFSGTLDTNLSVSTAHLGGATVRTMPTFIVMLHHKTTLSYLILFIIENNKYI